MIRKIGRVLEDHIEKIVLIVVGILCTWLLMTRVIFSPNVVSYNNEGKTVNVKPGEIDSLIETEARNVLQQKQNPGSSNIKIEPYKSRTSDFLALLEQPVSNISTPLITLNPNSIQSPDVPTGVYNLPDDIVGPVQNVEIEYIQAAAYIPTSTITLENSYSEDTSEPNNLDIVIVEAEYDVSELCDRLYEVFIDDVALEFRDPCFAKPIFATKNLQRRELTDKGTWSSWQNVPQPKTNSYGDLFDVVEDVKNLPAGGLELRKLQLDDRDIQIELLQPQGYQSASAKEEFYPPRIHRMYLDALADEERQERIDARAEENSDRTDSRRAGRSTRPNTNLYPTTGTQGVGNYDTQQTRGRRGRGGRGSTRGGLATYPDTATDRSRSGRDIGVGDLDTYTRQVEENISPMDEVYDEYDKILITFETDFAKMSEPLVFWAYDDTVEPLKTYQYRIRLGLLNQIAGEKANDLILWSEFSDTTEAVEIQGRTYFFAKSIKEAAKTINVTVCKYILGYWYSEDFSVSQGEAIGNVVETETDEETESRSRITDETTIRTTDDEFVEPETIDYNTGAFMVDVVAVNDWEGRDTLDSRNYHEMLYSFDGINIEHMPVNSRYWSQDMVRANAYVSRQLREEKEPLKDFGSNTRRQQSSLRGRDGRYNPDDYYRMDEQQNRR